MQDTIRKAPFRCPGCGFVQHEPEHLISTYCRSCGSHYEVKDQRADAPSHRVEEALGRALARPPRAIHCHRCGHTHGVSPSARSTICPACSTSIELVDLTFSSNVSRPVDTRGKLTIERAGHLNSTYVVCGSGLIEGRLNGTLHCEGELRLGCSGSLSCRITAKKVVVDKGAEVELAYPLTTTELSILGSIAGTFACSGSIHVFKTGRLRGHVLARSVVVDKGGVFLAENQIAPEVQARPKVTANSSAHETGGLGSPLPFSHLMAY